MNDPDPRPESGTGDADGHTVRQRRAELLKERIYVTFTTLAVVVALRSHVSETTAGQAAATMLIAVTGTLLAVFVADVVAHVTVEAALPDRSEFSHMVNVSLRSIGVITLPLIFVGLAGLGVWQLDGALRVATIVLVATLVAIGYLAVRRLPLTTAQRLVVLFAEFGLGALVVLLELLAHGAE